MKLKGHRVMSDAAVREFLAESGREVSAFAKTQLFHEPHAGSIASVRQGVGAYAVQRDIIDVATLGHWSDFAQKHHFMRRFDGQSPQDAYDTACRWVLDNAVEFAAGAVTGRGMLRLQALGNAFHAVQDSFAGGHAVRYKHLSATEPGAINHIKMYAGAEKDGHSHDDKEWEEKGNLSLSGALAKNACKALLFVIFGDVMRARAGGQKTLTSLSGWPAFQQKWLKACPRLGKERDSAHDLVDDFYNGIIWGDFNHAFNFDEKGMANAIYTTVGADAIKVRRVFERLHQYHTVDSDDVAEMYVNRLRAEPSSKVTKAVLADPLLVKLLIKILDEGWTTDGEQACIDFLRQRGAVFDTLPVGARGVANIA